MKKNKTIIIAEACDNHFGKLKTAKKFVDFAKSAGADYIKFQHHLLNYKHLLFLNRHLA